MEKTIYLHSGLPQTGTIFLQHNLFVRHLKINNLGKNKNLTDITLDLLEVF
jgi:hypothetical protein